MRSVKVGAEGFRIPLEVLGVDGYRHRQLCG
jgi:hypothetical protein